MIQCCWDRDRAIRKTAIECYSILNHCYEVMSSGKFDVYLSHAWVDKVNTYNYVLNTYIYIYIYYNIYRYF